MRAHLWPVPAAIVCTAVAAPAAQAWDAKGHMMIAYIAWKGMTPESRLAALATLRGNPKLHDMLTKGLPADLADADRDMYTFMIAATWPDMIRDKASPMSDQHRPNWHYINLPVAWDGKDRPDPSVEWAPGSEPANIVQAIAKCEADLKDEKTTPEERAIRLCWLLHLVGDLHQPLHAVAMFSPRYGKGDAGGNREVVKIGGEKRKLHAYWDELAGTSKKPKDAVDFADALLKDTKHSREALKAPLDEKSPAKWADESKALAKQFVYLEGRFPPENAEATEADPVALPEGYTAKAHEVAEGRLVVAGYRMGEALWRMCARPAR